MNRLFQSHDNRANQLDTCYRPDEVVCNIRRRQIRKNKCVGRLVNQFAERIILAHQFGIESEVSLHFTFHNHIRMFFLQHTGGGAHFNCCGPVSHRAEVGVGQHGDSRPDIELFHLFGCQFGNFHDFLGSWIEVDGGVGQKERAEFGHQDIHTRHLSDSGFGTDDLQSRTNCIRIISGKSADHGVGFACFHHHHAEIVAVLDFLTGIREYKPFALPFFVQVCGVAIHALVFFSRYRIFGVYDKYIIEFNPVFCHQSTHFFHIAKQNGLCDIFFHDYPYGFQHSRVFGIGKHHPLRILFGLGLNGPGQVVIYSESLGEVNGISFPVSNFLLRHPGVHSCPCNGRSNSGQQAGVHRFGDDIIWSEVQV